jgi:hypothetical protein
MFPSMSSYVEAEATSWPFTVAVALGMMDGVGVVSDWSGLEAQCAIEGEGVYR